jgi:hypothetical protein
MKFTLTFDVNEDDWFLNYGDHLRHATEAQHHAIESARVAIRSQFALMGIGVKV